LATTQNKKKEKSKKKGVKSGGANDTKDFIFEKK
jgi:hypothetical protein